MAAQGIHSYSETDLKAVNTIRFLSVDAVEKADSGHPGMPMGAAPMAYVLWTRFLKHNPADPSWFDRDRFVLSAGHGSMLLYSLLYLTGYGLSLEELKRFRQWDSRTPGHPERGVTPGVEVTTGPLGQGFGNGVGMAIAEAHLAAAFNRPGFPLVDHRTFGIVSDGDLMEGVASEAASLAGHLRLGKLIYLYDDNRVTLSAATDLAFSEDRAARFRAYGWHVQTVEDGNDLKKIEEALAAAVGNGDRPHLILVRTHLGYGAPHKQDTYAAHGSPLGEDEVKAAKKNLGWPLEPAFYVPQGVLERFRTALARGGELQLQWASMVSRYKKAFPEQAVEFSRLVRGELPADWESAVPSFSAGSGGEATRTASGKVMSALSSRLPELIGGSADLDPSTHTALKSHGDFQSPEENAKDRQGAAGGSWSYAGRNLHFGVREHAMGSIANGMAAHGGTLPFCSTFLIFSDYMRPPMRLASLMNLRVIYAFTHDSIALGEDGPTHQPVEQLLGLRSIPGFVLLRPADANETAACWKIIVGMRAGPAAIVLTRQKLPVLDPSRYPALKTGVARGAYVLAAEEPAGEKPRLVMAATGSEVHLALAARELLARDGVPARVVSMPCWKLFERQDGDYRAEVFPPGVPVLAVEAGVSLGWRSYLGDGAATVSVDRFGASAPGEELLEHYGMTAMSVYEAAKSLADAAAKGEPSGNGTQQPSYKA